MATKKSNKSLWVMLALIAAIIAVILLLPSCGNRNAKKGAETDAESTTLVKAGDTAPDFTVEMVDGSSVTLGDLKGKVVLLNFWATWCPPCRQELTRVQTDIIDRFASKEFVFLPVSRGEKREAVEAIKKGDTDTAKAILRPIPKKEPEAEAPPFLPSDLEELINAAANNLDFALKQHLVLVHRDILDTAEGRKAAVKSIDRVIDVATKYKNMIRRIEESGTEN